MAESKDVVEKQPEAPKHVEYASPKVKEKKPVDPETRGRTGYWITLGVTLLLGAGVGAYFWHKAHQAPAGAGGWGGPGVTEVRVTEVVPKTVPITLSFLGQTEASKTVEVRARVAAYLQKRLFEEGRPVTEGETLFILEKTNLEAQLSMEKAALLQAEARHEQARKQVERYTSLLGKDVVTQKELEDWQTTQAVAAADIQSAKARIQKAELDLSYTVIKAPMSGMTGKAMKDVGSYLDTMNPNADSLLTTVRQLDPIYVQFPVSERDLIKSQTLANAGTAFRSGSLKIRVKLADGSTYPYEGLIDFVDSRVDPATGTAIVRATLPNKDLLLRPGQFVRIEVLGLERKETIVVPQASVSQTPVGAIVMVVGADDKAEPRPVVLGEWVGSDWIVESGLKAGDRVIANHLVMLMPGAAVKVVAGPASQAATKSATENTASTEKATN